MPLTLPDVVNLALCNNPQTRLAWLSSRYYAEQAAISKSAYLPNVTINATENRTSGTEQQGVGITLGYLLYDFGARSANLENSKQLLVAANATQDATTQSVFLQAVQAYYQQRATAAALQAAEQSERAANESLIAAEARYCAGSATAADKLQAQTAYSQATLNRITARGNFNNAMGALANTLGLYANQPVMLEEGFSADIPETFEGDVNALIDLAISLRPDLRAAVAQLQAANSRVDAARSAGMPSLSLSASSQQNYSAGFNANTSSIGINLTIPLYSGFSTTYKVRAAETQQETSNTQLEQLKSKVALDVWSAFQNLSTATQAYRSSRTLLDSAEQSERVSMGRYRAGVGSILDVLNAQSALANARQQHVQTAFNWNISRATLAQAVGNLDARLMQTLINTGPAASN